MIVCGLVPHLQLALHPELYGRPVVIARWRENVLCCSPEATAAGVLPGMTQRQAQQLCPDATLLDPDQEAAERLRQRVSAALYDLSPVVEVRPEGVAWIDLEGVVQPRLALREMRRRLLVATGAEPRLGMAPGPFTARVAAAHARPGRVVRTADPATFLAPLPLATLELEPWQLERLHLLGLRTLAMVAAIGPRRLESQLGRPGRAAAERAAGREPDRLSAWRPPRCAGAGRQFEPPVEEREALLFVARALCQDLAAELGLRGAGARRLRLRLLAGTAGWEEREAAVRQPLTSTAELFGLAGSWLRSWQPAEPVAEMVLEIPELEPAGRRQLRLWVRGDGSAEEVKAAVERLQERHGEGVALHVEAALPHSPIPAQRFRLAPAGAPPAARAAAALAAPRRRREAGVSRNLGDFSCVQPLGRDVKPGSRPP